MSDSPLSIAASITGLLTFVAAVVAGFYAHALLGLRDAIDAPLEISNALDKIYHLETETDMLNNAYCASKIRQPDREYGTGDFKYFQGLYVQSLGRMRTMDRELRRSAELIDIGENRHDRVSRMKTSAAWMASRARILRDIEERKAESTRIFQIQLAMLSAKLDELSYHQNHHNGKCNIILSDLGDLSNGMMKMPTFPPSPTLSASAADRTSALLKIPSHAEISATPLPYYATAKASEQVTVIPLPAPV
ncbi:hypothetical protein ACMFMG_002973 [Clarireedia jacksonii]